MVEPAKFDLVRARHDTPGCERVLHFNNAGASLMPQPVLDAVVGHLQLEAEMGGYEAAEFAQDKFSPGTTGDGLFFGGGVKLLGVQALGVVSVFAWSVATGFLLFYVIKNLVGLRVSREEELRGLDIDEHGMEAYPGFSIFTTQ